MLSLLAIAVFAFCVTNLDDLVVLTAFNGHERFQFREILLGQYLGFGVLVALSLIGAIGATRYFTEHVRWLGLFPLAVGIIWLLQTKNQFEQEVFTHPLAFESGPNSRAGMIAGIGITDGADNIAVYVPLFAILQPQEVVSVVGIFLIAAGVWVFFARWLSERPFLVDRLHRYGDIVVPVVLMGLGIVILADVF